MAAMSQDIAALMTGKVTPADLLVKVTLVPVEVFGADEEDCRGCGATIRCGYGLMDAVSAWSDCNRAIGKIYRREDLEGRDEEGLKRCITVWVAESELPKFDRMYGDDSEVRGSSRCPACHVRYSDLPARHKLKRPECETALPHQPVWNLLPRNGRTPGKIPWKCTWHGWVEDERCDECKRERAEYLATGNWTPKPEMRP